MESVKKCKKLPEIIELTVCLKCNNKKGEYTYSTQNNKVDYSFIEVILW